MRRARSRICRWTSSIQGGAAREPPLRVLRAAALDVDADGDKRLAALDAVHRPLVHAHAPSMQHRADVLDMSTGRDAHLADATGRTDLHRQALAMARRAAATAWPSGALKGAARVRWASINDVARTALGRARAAALGSRPRPAVSAPGCRG